MLSDQIEKLKKYQFSVTFQNWISALLFLPLAIYFRFIIGTSLILDKDYTAYFRTVWILGTILVFWFIWKWLTADHVLLTGLEKYLAVFFAAACLSTVFSANTSLSLEKLIDISIYIFGIYILLDLKRYPVLWQGMINALLVAAGFSSLLILISAIPWIKLYQLTPSQILYAPTYLFKVLPRLPYSLGFHQSVTAGYLVMILPLAVYQVIQSKNIFWRLIQIVGLLLNMAVLFLTQSRGGLLGFACLILAFVLFYRKEICGFIVNHKILGILGITSLLAAGIGLIFFIGKTRGFSLGDRTVQMRFNQWRIAFQIIRESPWFGSGLGTFGQKYLELRDPLFYPGTFIHAHNQLIQITTELGILGLLSLLVIIWQGIRLLITEQGELPSSSKVSLIALGGLFGVLIPDAIFTNSMIVLLLLYYLVWLLPSGEHLPILGKTKGLSLLSLAAFLLACSSSWILWKIQPYNTALQAAERENWREASTALISALERDPSNPYYLHALAYTEGQIACQAEENVNQALDYFQQSFNTYPNWGIDHTNAAVLYAINGDYQNAADQMEIAVQNFPQSIFYHCLLGDYYSQLDKSEEAVASYGRCIIQSPQLLDTPFWQEDPKRREFIPAVFTQVETDLKNQSDIEIKKILASLYLAVNDVENADNIIQDYLSQNPDDLDGNIIHFKILDAGDDLAAAKEKIEELLFSNPRSSDLWIFKGKLAQQGGMEKDAESAFILGYRLEPSPKKTWILGSYYQDQGDFQAALDLYLNALNSFPSTSLEFSHRIAGRWPIQGEYLSCMPVLRTYDGYFNPALAAAQRVEALDCTLTACIYQKLISLNPTTEEAQTRLDSLACSSEFDLNQCFIDRTR